MVFTLQRYIFRELIKVFLMAVVALTLMLSLSSILRPVQEYGVGPRQVMHLMGYFLPIMLTFVLPMAALFASSLVYGRLANDNELDACRASGVSMLTLVYPGLILAIIVAIANLVLSFHVVPAFVHRAEKALKADAKQILFRNIQRKGYYKLPDGRYRIFADQANMNNNTLSGVIITEVKDNEIKKITVAESAKVNFNPHERFNEVQILAYKTSQMGTDDSGWVSFERLSVVSEFGSMLGDEIKFKKIDEIKRIRSDLMQFYPVAKLARNVYAQFTTELLQEDISSKIDANGTYKLHSDDRFVEFTAGGCSIGDEKRIHLEGDIVVTEISTVNKKLLRTLRCAKALLYVEGDELAPTLTMELYSPHWQMFDGSEGLSHRLAIRGLILPQSVTDKFTTEDVLESVSPASIKAGLKAEPSPKLMILQRKLERKMRSTLSTIKAEMHSRLVFGIGCVAMIMIGIGLGIILRYGHLLSAFAVSCIPAALLVVCVIMGKRVTKNLGTTAEAGIVLMWAGLAGLSILALLVYRKLLKN